MDRFLSSAVVYGVVVYFVYLADALASSGYMGKQKEKVNDVRFDL